MKGLDKSQLDLLVGTLTYQSKVFGIVQIEPERIGPCQATTDVGKVRRLCDVLAAWFTKRRGPA